MRDRAGACLGPVALGSGEGVDRRFSVTALRNAAAPFHSHYSCNSLARHKALGQRNGNPPNREQNVSS